MYIDETVLRETNTQQYNDLTKTFPQSKKKIHKVVSLKKKTPKLFYCNAKFGTERNGFTNVVMSAYS